MIARVVLAIGALREQLDLDGLRYEVAALRERGACVLRPHDLQHDTHGDGYNEPTYEPYCGRCGYDFDPRARRRPPTLAWSNREPLGGLILRWYDARFIVGCWIADRLADLAITLEGRF